MKFKVYLIRFLLISFSFVLYSIIVTFSHLGGIPVALLAALLIYFIYAVAKGKIGPKLPNVSSEMESQSAPSVALAQSFAPQKENDVAASRYHYLVETSDGDAMGMGEKELLVYTKQMESSAGTRKVEQFDCGQLFHLCPVCGTFSPVEQRACDCGYNFGDDKHGTISSSAFVKSRLRYRVAVCVLVVALLVSSAILSFGCYKAKQSLSELSEQAKTLQTDLEKTNSKLSTAQSALQYSVEGNTTLRTQLEDLENSVLSYYEFLKEHGTAEDLLIYYLYFNATS